MIDSAGWWQSAIELVSSFGFLSLKVVAIIFLPIYCVASIGLVWSLFNGDFREAPSKPLAVIFVIFMCLLFVADAYSVFIDWSMLTTFGILFSLQFLAGFLFMLLQWPEWKRQISEERKAEQESHAQARVSHPAMRLVEADLANNRQRASDMS